MRGSVILLLLICLSFCCRAGDTLRLASWNLQHFGKSKNDAAIAFIANNIQQFDIIAIQEVQKGKDGVKAVERLTDVLRKKGEAWSYAVSEPTTSANPDISEQYAFIWRTARITKQRAWLEQRYQGEMGREPYMLQLQCKGKQFTLVNFHAPPAKKQPEHEISYLKHFPSLYPGSMLIFMGDFNCTPANGVFRPLRSLGYRPALENQKTTLKMECRGKECLASPFDNFWYPATKIRLARSGVIHFYLSFPDMKQARKLSDHAPVFVELVL